MSASPRVKNAKNCPAPSPRAIVGDMFIAKLRPLTARAPSTLVELYLSRRDTLRRVLTARLGNKDEAEDVLQELYFRLSGVELPDDIREPVGYLFKIAANLARDHRRSRLRSQVRDGEWTKATNMMVGVDAVADTPAADKAYYAKQRVAAVRAALEELSPQCRRVFLLHKFDGLSHHEVAERLGIKRSTVEKHMTTALGHLMRKLGSD